MLNRGVARTPNAATNRHKAKCCVNTEAALNECRRGSIVAVCLAIVLTVALPAPAAAQYVRWRAEMVGTNSNTNRFVMGMSSVTPAMVAIMNSCPSPTTVGLVRCALRCLPALNSTVVSLFVAYGARYACRQRAEVAVGGVVQNGVCRR